ncbi:MAG: hypothetical protein AMJ65_04870 [Phycisphaerae bacterium SG8_4]|nr:MAG: hypothetical protein AMJ65_04870 [Phycisphaerae bacterium SG8_4]
MAKSNSRQVLMMVVLSAVSVSFMGCAGSLVQQSQSVRVSPVSAEYKLDGNLHGKMYILLAETSTGQEQHRYAVSDSLATALAEGCDPSPPQVTDDSQRRVDLSFLGFNGVDVRPARLSADGLDVLSFTDLTNRLNERDLASRHAEMKRFYQQNGMFRRTDLKFLADEIGADYIVLPCLLDISRWSKGRFSVGGVRFLQTQVVSGMLGLEIWDTRSGRKVFSATSDITIASERIREEPMSMEEAFKRAWYGIMKELPGQTPEFPDPPFNTAGIHEGPYVPEDNEPQQVETKTEVAVGEVAKAAG